MNIDKIEIQNYKSCIKTNFSLNSNLTALIGVNGAGKSNILNAILLFKNGGRRRSRYYKNTKSLSLLQSKIDLSIKFEKLGNIRFKAVIYYETDERNQDEILDIDLKYKLTENKSAKWESIDPEYFDVADFMNRRGLSDVPSDKKFQGEKAKFEINMIRSLTKINYYSATEFSNPSLCPISIELDEDRVRRRYRSSGAHSDLIEELYSAYSSGSLIFKRFINTIGKGGIGLIDDLTFIQHEIPNSSYKVKTGGKIEKIETAKKIIIPTVTVDGLTLSLNQLSEGTFKTLALIFNIINDDSDLLLIEEPEVCVHHGLLSSIIELIKLYSKDKQIVISTHSDYVLDKLDPENILLVRKQQGTKAQKLTKLLTKNEYSALKDYLETTGNLGEYWKEGGFEDE